MAANGRYTTNRPRGQNQRMNQLSYGAPMMSGPLQQHQRVMLSHGPMPVPGTMPQQMYMQQQPPAAVHFTGASSYHYQQPYQQPLIRQQFTPATHHYAGQPQQMILNTAPAANTAGIPNLLPDNNPMIGTTPHIPPYMGNPSAVLPQQHHTSMPSSSSIPATTKQSKAIKIVNPDTMKEVDTSNLKKTSPASSARSTPKPSAESEQVQQQFKQNVNKAADSKGNDVTKPSATPLVTVKQPNQQEHQNVAMVTTDPEPALQDTAQSIKSEVTSQLPSNSDAHQSEAVSEPPTGDVKQTADSSNGISDSESSLQQQQLVVEDNSNINVSMEAGDEVASESVETTKIIQEVDEQIKKIQDVVNKPEDVTMETLKGDLEKSNDQPMGEVGMATQQVDVNEHNVVTAGGEDSEVDHVSGSEHDAKMEKTGMEDSSAEKSGSELASEETASPEKASVEESIMEDDNMEECSMEQDNISKKEASMEDKSTEEDASALPIEMDTVETVNSSFVGDSTGPSSLEDMDRTQEHLTTVGMEMVGMETVTMTEEQLQCDEELPSDEDTTSDTIATAAAAVDNDSDEESRAQSDDKAELVDEDEGEGEEEELDDDGRQRRYKRDFLLSLQFLEQCRQRPPNLMNAEYIRKELPRPSETRFDPGYYDNPSGNRKKGMPYQGSKKKIELPSKEQVELRKAEKRWVRPSEVEVDLAQVEKETQELFRKFVGILNKLTPQKFETLANQALQMPINSEDRLKGCIDRIFIKALEEPNFSVAYAQLCRVLSKVTVEVGTGPDVKKKTFRSLLLTKCQQEFEKDKESDKVIAELKKKVEEASPEENKKQLEEEIDEKEYRRRRNYLGNIRFIGELFKIKMLSEGIMHECIRRLLQSTTDEEALECFAKLMFTIGKDLDHEKGQALIRQYMDRVELIINAGKISSRIKFFLQDVVELRNANWVPRRENNNPKKIDQIHQEAKQEEAEKMRELAAHPTIPIGGQRGSKGTLDMDRKKGIKDGSSKMGGDWSGGSDKDKKPVSSVPKLDSTKFRNLGKQPGTQLSLTPAGKLSMRPGGGSAVTMDKSSRQESKSKPSRSSGSKRSDSRSGSISAGPGGPPGQRRSFAAPDKQKERQQALELASNISGSSRSSSSSKGTESKPVSVLKRPAPDVLSEEEVEKKSSSLIAEFCQNLDYEAAIEEVKEMKSPGKHHTLVSQIINNVLERPSVARGNTGKLFHQLIRKNVIGKEKFTDGFTEVLEVAEDIEIDVPKIWFYLAEIVVPVIEDGTISLDILTKAPTSIMESGKGAQLLAEVLKLSEKIMGSGKATGLWTKSTVSYSTFKIQNVEEYKKKYGLQFLPSSSIIVHGGDIKRLMELLRSRDNTNTEIMHWIEKRYPESRERSLIFIRDLGTALFKTIIDGSGSSAKYNEELFDSRITIVTKYIEPQNDSNHQRQLEFLYALQMVLHELEQPAGVATIICKKLSEAGIFEDAAFHLWKTSGSETTGHGTTMLALKDFYDWLESTPVESDYSQ